MPLETSTDRKLPGGAGLVCRCVVGCLFLTLLPVNEPSAAACAGRHLDEWVQVQYVVDGDTLLLSDRRRVRLVGIDAPELGRDGKPDQDFAKQARDALVALLATHNNRVGLHYDRERLDTYGRLLAHAHLADGTNPAAVLLARGLAIQLTIPPNIRNAACYHRQEALAEQRKLGVWKLDRYQAMESQELRGHSPGFRLVRGRVSFIEEKSYALWIYLEGNMRLGIRRGDRNYFTGLEPKRLIGAPVEARGYVYGTSTHRTMWIRHPVALRMLNETSNDAAAE